LFVGAKNYWDRSNNDGASALNLRLTLDTSKKEQNESDKRYCKTREDQSQADAPEPMVTHKRCTEEKLCK